MLHYRTPFLSSPIRILAPSPPPLPLPFPSFTFNYLFSDHLLAGHYSVMLCKSSTSYYASIFFLIEAYNKWSNLTFYCGLCYPDVLDVKE